MASYSHILIASLVLLGLFQSSTSASPAPVEAPGPAKSPSKLIQQICNNTELSFGIQSFCFHILGSDHRANEATNVIDLAIRGYQIAEANTTRELHRIEELASSKSKKMSPGLKLGLKNCVVAFQNIASTYQNNQRIIKADCSTADYSVFVIVDKINSCEDQLKSYRKEVDPFVWTSLQDAEKFMVLNKAITDLCPPN